MWLLDYFRITYFFKDTTFFNLKLDIAFKIRYFNDKPKSIHNLILE